MKSKKMIVMLLILTMIMTLTLTACSGLIDNALNTLGLTPEATPEPPLEAPPAPVREEQEPQQTPDNTESADDPSLNTGRSFPFAFTATDIYGNTVTEASLGEKELFFIHYWGTWCAPCIAEMPDLAQLERDYHDRVGFLTLLDDFDNKAGAIEIYKNNDFPDPPHSVTVCGRTTFDARHEIMQMLSIQVVPTTVIIDSDGNMLEHLPGSQFANYARFLDMHLDTVSGGQAMSGEPDITLNKSTFAPGENINITITGVTQEMVDAQGWIGLFHAGAPHSDWEVLNIWTYLPKTGTIFFDLDVLTEAGDYEFRLYRNENENEASFITGFPFTIT